MVTYPPETNIAPENGWLEYDRFLLEWPIFRGKLAVSFRDRHHFKWIFTEDEKTLQRGHLTGGAASSKATPRNPCPKNPIKRLEALTFEWKFTISFSDDADFKKNHLFWVCFSFS